MCSPSFKGGLCCVGFFSQHELSLKGYVEPEAKMQNEGLMSTKIRSFKYGEGVLARSATSGLCEKVFFSSYQLFS